MQQQQQQQIKHSERTFAAANKPRADDDGSDASSDDDASVDRLTRELVLLTQARRALLLRSRRCLDLMAPRRRRLAALLHARRQPCHAIDRTGSVRLVARQPPAMQTAPLSNHGGNSISGSIDSVAVLPFGEPPASLTDALDRALRDAIGTTIW